MFLISPSDCPNTRWLHWDSTVPSAATAEKHSGVTVSPRLNEKKSHPVMTAIKPLISTLFVPLWQNTPLLWQADSDRPPPVCQHSVAARSGVMSPYQLLAFGSPSSKLEGSFMHFRGVQWPSFPVETQHTEEPMPHVSVYTLKGCTMLNIWIQTQSNKGSCFAAFINPSQPFLCTSWLTTYNERWRNR